MSPVRRVACDEVLVLCKEKALWKPNLCSFIDQDVAATYTEKCPELEGDGFAVVLCCVHRITRWCVFVPSMTRALLQRVF